MATLASGPTIHVWCEHDGLEPVWFARAAGVRMAWSRCGPEQALSDVRSALDAAGIASTDDVVAVRAL